jgi:hypothetical protein
VLEHDHERRVGAAAHREQRSHLALAELPGDVEDAAAQADLLRAARRAREARGGSRFGGSFERSRARFGDSASTVPVAAAAARGAQVGGALDRHLKDSTGACRPRSATLCLSKR